MEKKQTEKKSLKVKVYSTSSCPWCKRVKEFLKSHNISFQEIDVGTDRKAAEEMIQKSGQMGVPVIDVNGTIIVGFDQDMLKKALGI